MHAKLNPAVRPSSASRAPLVQLDRMSAYGADGRRFESCMGCNIATNPQVFSRSGWMLVEAVDRKPL